MKRREFLRLYLKKFMIALVLVGVIVYTLYHAMGKSSASLLTKSAESPCEKHAERKADQRKDQVKGAVRVRLLHLPRRCHDQIPKKCIHRRASFFRWEYSITKNDRMQVFFHFP